MAEEAKKEGIFNKISSFFRGVKTEFSKIIFPNQETLKKQTIAVIICSIVLAILIFVLDLIFKYLLGLIL